MRFPWTKERDREISIGSKATRRHFPKNQIRNTKYRWWSFIPKNLFEQYTRFSNAYFLIVACLQLWSAITPVNPITTWGPLIFVTSVTAVKELADDLRRWWSDYRANSRKYVVYRDGQQRSISSSKISVGDILKLHEEEEAPADCIIIKSSDTENGTAFITTANLDGETDLKERMAAKPTYTLTDAAIESFRGVITCPPPNDIVWRFDGQLSCEIAPKDPALAPPEAEMDSHAEQTPNLSPPTPLMAENMVLQGTSLKNTGHVYGVVVFTGNQTKLGMNKRVPPSKATKADKVINCSAAAVFAMQWMFVASYSVVGLWREYRVMPDEWYLNFNTDQAPWYEPIVIPLRFFLLMTYCIPISFKVTLDLCKTIYAFMINMDRDMVNQKTGSGVSAKNTGIIEDLGQIQHVFTDKTGTLTENVMVFKKVSINGTQYGEGVAASALDDRTLAEKVSAGDPHVLWFLRVLGLCHTVDVDEADKATILRGEAYKATSPDEFALVHAACRMGVAFVGSDRLTTSIALHAGNNTTPKVEKYELLEVLEFTSDRRRMSVILRDPAGQVILLTKGADDIVLGRLSRNDEKTSRIRGVTDRHLASYGNTGLRTLTIAMRNIPAEEFAQWRKDYDSASTQLVGRDRLRNELMDMIETDLTLLGVTAIEDQLQEGVPDTIAFLRQAGIRFWMLTGDKLETARQIALSCKLMAETAAFILVAGTNEDEVVSSLEKAAVTYDRAREGGREAILAVTGPTFKHVEESKTARVAFRRLGLKCDSVVCSRMAPTQKAQVVRLIKRTGVMTLAIGDGGNDISMIQEAHVGVGLEGREGLQAARAADFSMGGFRFLKRLLTFHGRYSYLRSAWIVQYSFYKSVIIGVGQISYNILAAFSGASLMMSNDLTLYNLAYTFLPPLVYTLDRDVPALCPMEYPELYKQSQKSKDHSYLTWFLWIARGLYHVFVIEAVLYVVGSAWVQSDGSPVDKSIIAETHIVSLMTLQLVTQLTDLHTWNLVTLLVVLLSYGSLWAFHAFMCVLFPTKDLYGVLRRTFVDPQFWMAIVLIVTFAYVPIIAFRTARQIVRPRLSDTLRFNNAVAWSVGRKSIRGM